MLSDARKSTRKDRTQMGALLLLEETRGVSNCGPCHLH